MKIALNLKLSAFVLFILGTPPFLLFAEEQPTLKPLMLQDAKEDFFEGKVSFGKEVVKNSGYLETFAIYQAVRDEDLSLCSQVGSRQIAKQLLYLRYAGENRCQDIDNPAFQELCQVVNSGSCSALSGWKKSFCELSLKNEIEALTQLAGDKESHQNIINFFALAIPVDNDTVSLALGIYNGFKHYSTMACDKFLKNSDLHLSWRLSCKLIFSDDFEKDKESIIRDLSLFILDREVNEPGLCKNMDNSLIRNACFDPANKTLSDAW